MEELLKPKEAGRLLKHSPQTLATWRMRQQGPKYLRVGGSILYRPSDLEAFITRRGLFTVTSSPQTFSLPIGATPRFWISGWPR
jgi:hypothetical protein